MQRKLTLRLDEELIRKAKKYAKKRGKSVSQMVAAYFALLDEPLDFDEEELSPRVRSLIGAFKGAQVDEKDYYDYLEKKYS